MPNQEAALRPRHIFIIGQTKITIISVAFVPATTWEYHMTMVLIYLRFTALTLHQITSILHAEYIVYLGDKNKKRLDHFCKLEKPYLKIDKTHHT